MIRNRDDSRWEITAHASEESFLADVRLDGAHSIAKAGQYLDVYIENRLSPTTLVVFNSALTDKVPTVPVFSGRSLARAAGINLIAVSDPSIGMGDINLTWYLGNRNMGPLRPALSPIIRHALESLRTKRTVLFGASGGGYAVANFAHDFPGCIAIAVNPRLNMGRRPIPDIPNYLKVCHRTVNSTPMKRLRGEYVIEEISSLTMEGLNHHFLLYQNSNDSVFLNNQAMPFIDAVGEDPNLHVCFNADNPGHSPIPGEVIRKILDALAVPGDDIADIRSAGFLSVSNSLARLDSLVSRSNV